MSIECPNCKTIWVHQQKKCPTCGADSNGRFPSKQTTFSLMQPALTPPPAPTPDVPADWLGATPSEPSAPSSDSYSSGGGGDFSGGGGSDF